METIKCQDHFSMLPIVPFTIMDVNPIRSFYCIYQLLQKKLFIATITQLRGLELLIAKTPLLHMLYYMDWLTHDVWTRTGGWEFNCSHGAGTSSPSHWQQIEEQAPKPMGWMMCFLLMTLFPPRSSVLIYINIYIYIYICTFYMSYFIGRIYTHNRSVIQHWWSCILSHSIGLYFGGVLGSWVECHFLFSLVYQLCLALWW